ncbi:MAG TPA: cyclic nucleotide-binding domain-containing protein [Polyangiaceae bacterium]|jgi:hypothetical protein
MSEVVGIPPAIDTDVEDVVWALQTSASLWKRNERVDAIVWLRRAAQAAGEAEHDDRALLLAREAAELSDWIAKNPMAPLSTGPTVSSIPPNDSAGGGVDDLLRTSLPDIVIEETPQVSMSAMTEPHAFMPVAVPQAPVAPITSDLIPISEPSSVSVYQSVASERTSENVQTAAEAHAGMLDPWSAPTDEVSAPVLSVPAVISSDDYEDEVVTSAKLVIPPAEPAMVMNAPVLPNVRPPPHKPPPPRRATPPAPKPPEPEEEDEDDAVTSSVIISTRPRTPPPPEPEVPRVRPEATLVSPGNVSKPKPASEVDLSEVNALADLPDDARAELERGATVHRLSHDEEVMGFALAYVVEGEIDVAAQIVDAPADRITKGAVLKARGTVAESVPLRLVCGSDTAIVATWDAAQIEPAFKACPWVEDDLRAAANRMQALVGVTLGPLAERLDTSLRAQVTSKLELRELAEGDVLVQSGDPVRDLCLVGQGSVELVKDGAVIGEVGVGEFLFPAEIMGGGRATATARAGKGGALVLASDRAVAQELMVTCPPLLEIFAGM